MNWMLLIPMLICLIFSAYFSATETAFTACNRIRLKNMAQNGDARAKKVLETAEQYDKLLSTILIGNNIVNILLTTLATLFFVEAFVNGAAISTVVTTVVVLIFGEITPKSIAKVKADSFALHTVSLLRFFAIVLAPLNALFGLWRKLVNKIFKEKDVQTMTEEELMTIVDEVEEEGGINENEGTLIRSAIEFGDATAQEILTPRVDVVSIDDETPFSEIGALFRESGFSRLPVYHESMDDVIGILHEKEYYTLAQEENPDWKAALQKPIFVSQHTKISNLMQTFKTQHGHMAIVLDEMGGMMGVVTLEDVIEELIGDVWDEHDTVVEEIRALPDGAYSVLGSTHLDTFFEYFEIELPEEEQEELPQTVNGWMMILFEDIPQTGAQTESNGLRITVTDSDAQKIEEIRVEKIAPITEQADD
jgi:CBS domain containing-hemolysin-like protein